MRTHEDVLREERLALLRGAEYPGMATMRWAADEIERLEAKLDDARLVLAATARVA